MNSTTWNIFKNFVSSRGLSIQWIDLDTHFWLKAFDGQFSLECSLDKTVQAEETLDFETNFKPGGNMPLGMQSPFSAKTVGTKRLYKRINGVSVDLVEGENNIVFVIPYNWVKITGLEVINGESLDFVGMFVLDTATGSYSTVPNYPLNQFGFNVQVSKDYYAYKSEFDADLYKNMQIKLVYTSKSAKTVGFNFIINEVK